ncbi:MAG: hypothetical protein IPL78_18120 [Chloroflexi bacterium]|nr:hypothetical protein [Chloroflexota bacterium]
MMKALVTIAHSLILWAYDNPSFVEQAAANDSFMGYTQLEIVPIQFEDHGIATTTSYQAHCQLCGRDWHIQERGGYHYPIYSWAETTDR